MGEKREKIIKELKLAAVKLGHSPRRREIPNLARRCYYYFDSFNKAKEVANLEVFSIKNQKVDIKLLKKDINIVKILALINFDGHLARDLKSSYYSSKNIKDVRLFENIIKKKFKIGCKIKENSTGSRKQTHLCWIFNKNLLKKLNEIGIVKGDKVTSSYLTPIWIINNKDFSKEFLKMAFFCEGSNKEEKGRKPRIRFSMHKSESLLNNGVKFINQLKSMLKRFNIKTTPIYISNARIRKDGIKVKLLAFRIKQEDINKFINKIGWFK